jgi:nucleotide-binding universal stress UspA family protein
VINVLPPPALSSRILASAEAREAQQGCLVEAQELLRRHGIDAAALAPSGDPAKEIVAAARDRHADLIIVGHEQRRFPRPRSVSSALVRHAPCDVLVVHTTPGGTG